MASLLEIAELFIFIENANHPIDLYPHIYKYTSTIEKFYNSKHETINNYAIYRNYNKNYPEINFVLSDIIDHSYNTNNNWEHIYKLFCTLFWLYIKKKNQVDDLVNQFKNQLTI